MIILLLLILCLILQAIAILGGMNPETAAMFGCVLFLAGSALALALSPRPQQPGPTQERKKTYITVANMRKKDGDQ